MDPAPSKHKRNISGFLNKKWNKAFRRSPSPGPSTSPKPSQAQSVQSNSSPPSGSIVSLAGQVLVPPQAQVQVSASLPVLNNSISTPEGPRDVPPSIVVLAEAAEPSTTNENQLNPIAPISSISHPGRATSGTWMGLRSALRALHEKTGLFPPLQSAIGTFVDCLDVLEVAVKNQQSYEELSNELIDLAKLLTQHLEQSSSAPMSASIVNIARSIEQQAKLIENKRVRGTTGRVMEANADMEDLERHYRRIGALFRQLQADANLSIWNIVNDQMANTRLEGLMPVKLANHDSKLSGGISRRTCTANTRTAILAGLNDWSNSPEAADMYWMNGMAGTGKTTIACSFSESLEGHKQLAASFFCTRATPECREVARIIPTIAYQLARYSVPFQSALCETLGQDPDVGAKNLLKQFERLLKEPLLKVKEAIPNNLVVVIDALDECSDMREVELLLSILLKFVKEIPLRFFVTSRPEPEIYKRMLVRGQGAGDVLRLHDVEKFLVQADIEVYLAEELEFMSPTPNQVEELAKRSGNLFIYAATLVRYIRPGKGSIHPHKRLHSALAMTSRPNKLHAEIDELYTAILDAAIEGEGLEDEERDDMRNVLWVAVCVQEPVGVDTIAAMAGLQDVEQVITALDALRSVIHFSEASGLVSTLHASFPDFVFDETRSKSFSCNLAEHNGLLTRRCFEVMKAQLRFNICQLESSFMPDSEVYDLGERVKQAISSPLWYACRYWGDHLRYSSYSDLLCTVLSEFLSTRLLFWMEVLNLKREMNLGAGIILKVMLWLLTGLAPADVSKLAEDCRNFVTTFAANPVSQCTPHIYISSLPFCSKSSSVFKQYWKKMRGMINVSGSAMQRRETAPLASWNTDPMVYSAVYSPDGSCIAVGCVDGSVRVLSAYNGTLVASPFQGHTSWVFSIGYSSDGTRIVSGSDDNTIRVWSARDGTLLVGPFWGHSSQVLSVGYSPDDTNIVSGSSDKTILVWNAHDGTVLVGPLQGHTGPVWSVSYSPDGSRIVSGSADGSVRVWSASNGVLLAGPFQGHTDAVMSVRYSPDCSRIVSGSKDRTIRIWDAHNGELVAGPFQTHSATVRAVGYSSDGVRIVSGSDDYTILVWNAHDGTLFAGPLQGHTSWVWSVGYSPDGSRIMSASSDNTIRVWSAHNDTLLTDPVQRHTKRVMSVEYSPDGTHIVSGYEDETIRVWSTHDGTLLASPLQGHTGSVLSVRYSPNGSRIVSGSLDKTIRVWSAHDGTLLAGPFQGHTGPVRAVEYSPDGTHVVSGSDDKTIRVWAAHNGALLAGPFQGHAGTVLSVGYSPDGTRIVSGSEDETIRVWGAHDGELLANLFQGHTGAVWSIGYSPDGTRIVSGSGNATIVWSAHDGTLLANLQGHTSGVSSVRFSPDGTNIVTGSADGTIRVWSAHNGTHIAGPFRGHAGPVLSVGYSPDGSRIVSGSVDETIRVWSTHDGARIASPFRGHSSSDMSLASPIASGIESDSNRPATTQTSPPTNSHTRKPILAFTGRATRDDGWVVNSHSQLIFWVPLELAGYLPTTHELLVIYPHDQFQIDHDDALLGEHWHRCYKPE